MESILFIILEKDVGATINRKILQTKTKTWFLL